MTPPATEWNDVLKRLENLERWNRRVKQAGTVVLILAASVLLVGQAQGCRRTVERTVEANEFVLKDSSGIVRGRFSMTEQGPELGLFDSSGQQRIASLRLSCKSLQGEPGKTSTQESCSSQLSLKESHENAFEVFLAAGRTASTVQVGEVFQAKDEVEALLADLAGVEGFTLSETPRVALQSSNEGQRVELLDKQGFQTIVGTTLEAPRTDESHKTSAASVVLFDKDKNVLWKAP
ncbi:MAG: hypothetical protein HY313_11155 [Acidobacteria bacterium]|nr:hypothetical protein [Acidobacteriota bacterium]